MAAKDRAYTGLRNASFSNLLLTLRCLIGCLTLGYVRRIPPLTLLLAGATLLLPCCATPRQVGPDPLVLMQQGQYESAVVQYQKRLESDPEDLDALKNVGQCYFQLKKYAEAAVALRKATKIDSRDARSWALLGESLVQINEKQEAAAAFHAALSNDRSNQEYQHQLRIISEELKMYEQYVDAVRELLTDGPEDAPALLELGKSYLDAGHFTAAAKAFKGVLSVSPDSPEVTSLLGLALFLAGEYQEAADVFLDAEKSDPTNIMNPRTRGHALLHLTRYREAAVSFEHALKIDKNDRDSIAGMALAYHAMGRDREAIRLLERATRRDKDSELLWIATARIALDRKQWPGAKNAIDSALRVNPNSPDALNLQGAWLLQQGRVDKAQEPLQKSLLLDPNRAETHVLLAQLYDASGNDAAAIASARSANSMDPQNLDALLWLAKMLEKTGEYEHALGTYERLQRRKREDSSFAYAVGILHLALNHTDEAKEVASSMVRAWPKDFRSYVLLARVQIFESQVDDARQSTARALRSDPNHSDVHLVIGDLERQQGNEKRAEASYRVAIRRDNSNRAAHLALGEMLLARGATAAGRGELEMVVKLAPSSVEAVRAKQLLKPK